ncbi:DNA-J chaperone, putative [Bodo saltans]|uniref:DNA-J chaperone, putative n=1 Tax=Bodo saltans TaxID=75058 RepID=A0A0S4JWY5_BODSA|nr:DNA-J chaperone, putative [Bodo saltans]|eukprot:CUG93098.1 DNA-J chaperone, putative [Bodo saltans]
MRRFMLCQYLALANQLPFGELMMKAHRSMGSTGLITPAEAEYVRKLEELDPTSPKAIFSTRAPRTLIRGIGGACWNVGVGTCLAPLVALSMFPHQIHQHGLVKGIVPALIMANVWGASFATLGYVAAIQQLSFGVVHQALAPVHFLFTKKVWNLYTCRFEHPSTAASWPDGLEHELPTETLRDYGMRRVSKNKNSREKNNTKYDSPNKKSQKPTRTHYDTMGISSDASEKEIKTAYKKMAVKLHPDRNPSKTAHEDFDELTKAYRVLSNPQKRKKYDLAGDDGVEDTGAKKREGVRALFGGDLVYPLLGDVRLGAFSLRVIDGLDMTPDELAVVHMRMMLTSRDTLLSEYLQGYQVGAAPATAEGKAPSSSSGAVSASSSSTWNGAIRGKVHKFINTGLAKETLQVIGKEYLRVCAHASGSPINRLHQGLTDVLPDRFWTRISQIKVLAKARPSMVSDTAVMVDLAWYLSISELKYTARFAAMSAVHDVSVPPEERQRRLEGLRELGNFFVASGSPYTGANKRTVDALMDSLRSYQQSKGREQQNSD